MLRAIKNYFILRKVRRRLRLLGQMLDSIDRGFARNRIPRWKRRQFWDDFINDHENRKKFIKEMKLQ